MSNIASTAFVVTGPEKDIRSLYSTMKELEDLPEPLIPNGWGTTWLGFLLKQLGYDWNSISCQGKWSNLQLTKNILSKTEYRLCFNVESVWSRPIEVVETLKHHYPSLSFYFMEEELGMGIFQTNDEHGCFFPDTIIIDEEDGKIDYYTPDRALERLSELFEQEIVTWDEADFIVDAYNMQQDLEDGGKHIWIHKATFVYC